MEKLLEKLEISNDKDVNNNEFYNKYRLENIEAKLLSESDLNNNHEDRFKHINFDICETKFKDELSIFENSLFKLVFDLPTPRNHLIIIFKENTYRKSHKSARDLKDEELKSLFSLVHEFTEVIKAEREHFELSFHTGNWATSNHFHAHLCIDLQLYLRLLEAKRPHFDEENWRPTKNWDTSLSSENKYDLYIKNVLNYTSSIKLLHIHKYNEMELAQIETFDEKAKCLKYVLPFYNKSLFLTNYDDYSPKIWFNLKDTPRSKLTIAEQRFESVKAMIDYANKNGYFEKTNGCHICVDLIEPVNGYLLIRIDDFYLKHPNRELFLKNFRKKNEAKGSKSL